MKIREITLHNYRAIKDATFYAADYGLLIGANNSGKTSVLDALRNCYEKDIKFDHQRDFPKFGTDDKESWVEVEYVLHDTDPNKNGDDKVMHVGVNKLIQDRRNAFTQIIHLFADDLETFLGFKVPDKDHRKPSRLLLGLREGKINAAQVEALCRLVEELAGVPPP